MFDDENEFDFDESLVESFELAWGGSPRRERLSKKNEAAIDSLIGKGRHAVEGLSTPWYYRDLAAWGVKRCLEEAGWRVLAVYGYTRHTPTYRDIKTDADKQEACLLSGQMAIEKGGVRLIVTVDLRGTLGNYVQVEGHKDSEEAAKKLVEALDVYLTDHNFYRGKTVTLTEDGLEFLCPDCRAWETVFLPPDVKDMIRRNTVGFLRNAERLTQHGIPIKRGIILAGAPGTGKTAVCKALVSEATGLTCLFTDASEMARPRYFGNLYRIARDLAPCIVFIEDLDLIGQDRIRDRVTPQLVALLAEMDGITEMDRIVTVATTNNAETLDQALTKRPARFDRVVTIPVPNPCLRAAQIDCLSSKIPLSPEAKEYLCRRTEGFSPAQVQEAVYGLEINREDGEGAGSKEVFTTADVDRSISEMKHSTDRVMGFDIMNRH